MMDGAPLHVWHEQVAGGCHRAAGPLRVRLGLHLLHVRQGRAERFLFLDHCKDELIRGGVLAKIDRELSLSTFPITRAPEEDVNLLSQLLIQIAVLRSQAERGNLRLLARRVCVWDAYLVA